MACFGWMLRWMVIRVWQCPCSHHCTLNRHVCLACPRQLVSIAMVVDCFPAILHPQDDGGRPGTGRSIRSGRSGKTGGSKRLKLQNKGKLDVLEDILQQDFGTNSGSSSPLLQDTIDPLGFAMIPSSDSGKKKKGDRDRASSDTSDGSSPLRVPSSRRSVKPGGKALQSVSEVSRELDDDIITTHVPLPPAASPLKKHSVQ